MLNLNVLTQSELTVLLLSVSSVFALLLKKTLRCSQSSALSDISPELKQEAAQRKAGLREVSDRQLATALSKPHILACDHCQ